MKKKTELSERNAIIEKMNLIFDRITVIDKERKTLVQEMKDVLPIKEGDKVNVMNRDDNDKPVRFAFVNSIKIKSRGKEEKADLEFDLQKCKSDGTKSRHAEYLKYGEYITKIK